MKESRALSMQSNVRVVIGYVERHTGRDERVKI